MKELKEMILAAINNINITSLLDHSISLATAFVHGCIIGFERQVHQRTAGPRMNALVAVGVIYVQSIHAPKEHALSRKKNCDYSGATR